MKKQIEIGQIVVQRMNGIQGIVVAHKKTSHNSYYNKVVIHCFFAPYNSHLVGKQLELSFGDLIVLAS